MVFIMIIYYSFLKVSSAFTCGLGCFLLSSSMTFFPWVSPWTVLSTPSVTPPVAGMHKSPFLADLFCVISITRTHWVSLNIHSLSRLSGPEQQPWKDSRSYVRCWVIGVCLCSREHWEERDMSPEAEEGQHQSWILRNMKSGSRDISHAQELPGV